MSLCWTMKSTLWRPFFGTDEFFRHTLVLPWPFSRRKEDLGEGWGERIFPALVVVVRPWWLCWEARHRDMRDYIRFERAYYKALYAEWFPRDDDDDHEAWERHAREWEPRRPPTPRAWAR